MSAPLLRAEQLARHYVVGRGLFKEAATVRALARADFSLGAGKTLAVVGESGCGKSTLARLLTRIEQPSAGRLLIDGVTVAGDGCDVDNGGRDSGNGGGDSGNGAPDVKTGRQTVQMVFQDPYGSLNPRKKIGAILEEPLLINTSLSAAQRRDAARGMMAKVGLRAEHYSRYPHMFSGGQRQRIAIARALMLRPRIVVLDEPVSALDVSVRAQVLNLLADLQEEFNLAYLFISHDLSVVRHVADEVMVMYLGRVVEHGPRDEVFNRPRHPYTRALLSATPVADPEGKRARIRLEGELPSPLNPPPGCAFHPRCPHAEQRCLLELPKILPPPGAPSVKVACHAVEEGRL